MPHHQNLQPGGFVRYPPYPSSSDSMESEAGSANGFGERTNNADNEFFVGDPDLEQLDPWRRSVPSPMPRITDAITQGTSWTDLALASWCPPLLPHQPLPSSPVIISILLASASACPSLRDQVVPSCGKLANASISRPNQHFSGTKRRPCISSERGHPADEIAIGMLCSSATGSGVVARWGQAAQLCRVLPPGW